MKTLDFAVMLKTYAADIDYAQRLIQSFHRHNMDGLHLFCVVPRSDLHLFQSLEAETISVLSEEPFEQYFTSSEVHGIRPGYINQEIVKLAFWEIGCSHNYFCIDSEAVFIRDFGHADFIAPDGFPYTVLVEDKELLVEPEYYSQYWKSREDSHRLIAETLSMSDPIIRTCHGHQTFSRVVLQDFKDNFLTPRGWSYLDALRISPYEFTWYNLWLQSRHQIPIHQREPLVKVFHNESQHMEYVLREVTIEDVARAYLAVLINSNFTRDLGVLDFGEPKAHALAHYLNYTDLVRLGRAKLHSTFVRLMRKLG